MRFTNIFRLFFLPLLISGVLNLVAADSADHSCPTSPKDVSLPDFPKGFKPCWHDTLPAENHWPDANDFKTHVCDEKRAGRMSTTIHNNLSETLARARLRVCDNSHYVLHSCYYSTCEAKPRWIHNFLVPLCSTGNGKPEAFCTIGNKYPYEKRTILSIEQAEILMKLSCNYEWFKFQHLIKSDWKTFCKIYPAPVPQLKMAPVPVAAFREPEAIIPPTIRKHTKNAAALLKLNNCLNGCTFDDDAVTSSLERLDFAVNGLRNNTATTAGISYPEALHLLEQYSKDELGSPISFGDPNSPIFLKDDSDAENDEIDDTSKNARLCP